MQNGYIASFNGKVRDECLNEHWFTSLAQAREVIGEWRRDHDEVRPHSSCGRIPRPGSPPTIGAKAPPRYPSARGFASNDWYGRWGGVNCTLGLRIPQ